MGADIENRLLAQANCASPPEDELLREAAAEIGRLRGEVENITAEAIEWRDKLHAATPSPAMPNGVEVEGFALNLAVADDALRKVAEICPVTPPEVASLRAVIVGARALLRAANNRDAAGMVLSNDGTSEAQFIADGENLNCPRCGGSGHVGDTPAAVPAGEAVARGGECSSNCMATMSCDNSCKPTPQPADGEAVAPFVWFATDDDGRYGIGADRDGAVRDLGGLPEAVSRAFPLYTTPPAAQVQAAAQEGSDHG